MDTKHFTIVFEGDIRNVGGNPFRMENPFGTAVKIAVGDALELPEEPLGDIEARAND